MGTGGAGKLKGTRILHDFIAFLNFSIIVHDFELGDGIDVPSFKNTGESGVYKIKFYGKTLKITIEEDK